MRETGIDFLGPLPWGTHFCLFYETKEDLIEILVPYFKAGLENNEFCMWVTSEPLKAQAAKRALRRAVKNLDDYIEKGQIEILPHSQWYTKSGRFEADKVLQGWVEKEAEAVKSGFDGLRLSGNTFWLEREDWKDFADYEVAVNDLILEHRILALCTYSLHRCGASEIMSVVSSHQFATIRHNNKWEAVENAEQRRAQEALKASEERYRTLFDGVPMGLYRSTPEGQNMDANLAALQMLGYPDLKSLQAVNVADLYVDPQERKRWQALMEVEGVVLDFEVQLRRRDGRIIWVRDSARAVRDADSRVLYYEGSLEDITERKQAAEEIRRKAEELAALYDVSLDVAAQLETQELLQTILERAIRLLNAKGGGIYIYDPAKREVELRASYGYFSKDYTGTRLTLGEGLSGKVAQTGEPLVVKDYAHWEGRSPQYEGEPSVTVLGVPLKRGDELLGVLFINHEVEKGFDEGEIRLATLFANQAAIAIENARLYEQTDEKLGHRVAELTALNVIAQSLTRSLELDEILESIVTRVAQVMQARICTIRLVKGNQLTVGAAVGYRDEASRQHTIKIDKHLARIVRDQQPLVVEDLWVAEDIPPSRRMRAWREEVHSFLGVPMISKRKTIGVLSIYREKPHLFSEEEVGLLSTIANQAAIAIEDARLYEKVREHAEELERLVQERTKELQAIHAELLQSAKLAALGQLAAGVAHELNNPLGAISGYLELLKEEVELGPQEMDYMERIEKRIQQSTKIVAELKSLGTPSEPVWQIVNVNDILEVTLSLVERRLSFHQIKVQKDITPALPLMRADPDRLEQVFINLITNARQAMGEGGTLRVASRESRNGEWVEIIFADTGEGIAKEHLGKIFDPFFTTRSPGKGMGLGLSLSHRHIKDHGGAIDVWSEKGRGTVFRVALPPSGAKRCWEILDCDKKERCKAVRENADYRCWSVMEDVSRCKGCEVYRRKALPPLDGTLLPQ